MFAVWANLHGGFLAGLILLWTYSLCNLVQDRGSASVSRDLLIAVLSTVATLVNPYGPRLFSIFGAVQSLTFSHISEWLPMLAPPLTPLWEIVCAGTIVCVALSLWYKTRDRRWSHLVWILAFTAMTLDARRNVADLAFVCLAVCSAYYRSRSANAGGVATDSKPGNGGGWRLAAIAVYAAAVWTVVPRVGGWPLTPTSNLPTTMAEVVEKYNLGVHVFNDYDYGSYLEWRFAGHPGLYVDGINAYPDSVFADYIDILRATPRGQSLIEAQQIDCVIGRGHEFGEPDIPMLYVQVAVDPQWALVYYGSDGPIWVRRTPGNRALCQGVPTYHGQTPADFEQYLHECAHVEGR